MDIKDLTETKKLIESEKDWKEIVNTLSESIYADRSQIRSAVKYVMSNLDLNPRHDIFVVLFEDWNTNSWMHLEASRLILGDAIKRFEQRHDVGVFAGFRLDGGETHTAADIEDKITEGLMTY